MGQLIWGTVTDGDDPFRRWRIAAVVAIVVACVYTLTPGLARAAQTNSPLAGGSTFQGADGNQDAANPLTDWQTYADTAPGSNTAVTKLDSPVGTGNPAGPDFFYAGKEDTPDAWTLASDSGGIEPGKSNALAASSVRDPLQSKSFFYFAFIRETDSNADAFYGVELNQRTSMWTNSKSTSVPCRTTGDLMISYHIDANTKNVNVSAHRWQGNDQSATHPECPTGGSGTFAPVTLGINAQGHMNFESQIANYIRQDVLGTTLTAGRFGEGAINLSDTIGVGSNPCFSFGQVQLHSRSSGAFDSALQDTVDPAPLAVRNCSLSGNKFRDDNGDGVRQANEPGLQGWTFWVDYDDDGTIDANEPSGVSDATGAYTISNINPAAQGQGANQGPFRIHERAPAGLTGYSCTYPNAGTTGGGVDAHGCYWEATFSSTGNQSGFDFLNKPPGKIVVKKVNVGGTQTDAFGFSTTGLGADFTLAASDSSGQVFDGVAGGTYTVTEKSTGQPAGYRLTDIDCDDTDSTQALNADRRATIVVAPGETVTCTFKNTKDASLRVVKSVVNDDGGTATASAFSLHVKQGGADVGGSPAAGSATGTVYSLAPGPYAVSEAAPPAGYAQSGGVTGDCAANGDITLAAGETKTCTITNDDIAPRLTVVKAVTNDDGGSKAAGDFTMNVTGTGVSDASFAGVAGPGGKTVTLDAGSYSVDEGAHDGYAKTLSADCAGTIAIGESKTCTVSNDDIAPRLTVIKTVVNDHGGTKAAGDFTMNVTGTGVSDPSFAGVAGPGGKTVTLDAGTYSVDEGAHDGYAKSLSADCAGTIAIGESKTCTVTNNDIAPQLKVVKTVVNDHGGTKSAGDFTMNVTGTDVSDPSFAGVAGPGGKTVTLDAGSYSADEGSHDGYAKTLSADCSGTIAIGESKTCTITNNDIAPRLTVIKAVTNDDGGSKSAGDFTMNVTGTGVSDASFAGVAGPGGKTVTLDAGSYSVDEGAHDGYAKSLSSDCAGTIAIGESKTCTITNNDIAPQLKVIKTVVNDHGGAKSAGDFTMNVTGTDVSDPSFAGIAGPNGKTVTLDAGAYSVDEGAHDGYAKSLSADCTGSIAIGESKTCTITNNDIAPRLTVIKTVVNGHGGTKAAGDFTMNVTGTDVSDPSFAGVAGPNGKTVTLDAGSYGVDEGAHDGYAKSLSADCAGTIAIGESKTCTMSNNDIAPQLTVVKTVVNDDGGTKAAGDFTMNVTGTDVSDASFAGVAGPAGKTVTLDAGSYGVDEGAHDGYAKSLSADCAGTIAIGESKTCTVTNDDIAAKLVVIKHVENRGGSAGKASGFQITVDDPGTNPPSFAGAESPGTEVPVDPGQYSVDEVEDPAYAKSLSAGCSGSIAIGETKACTITNTRRTGTLEVVKALRPANDGGRFDLQIDDVTKSGPNGVGDKGTTGTTTVATGTHKVGELGHAGTDLANYQGSTSCADAKGAPVTVGVNGAVTVSEGDAIVCTITNTRKTNPAIAVDKKERRGSTASFTNGPIDVHVGDTIEYEIDVTNPGDTPLTVSLADPQCDPGTLTGPTGDANSNGLLDPGETLTWRCSHVVEAGDGEQVVNVAKATGVDPLGKVVDREDRVVADVLDPSVVVVKAGDEIAYHGDTVTYEFTVSNTGNAALHDVRVTDDRCADVSAAPVRKVNDDGDGLLEKTGADGVNPEQWIFSCSRAIGAHAADEENPVVNTATVTAVDSLDRTVTSTDRHSTRIIHPAVSVDKTGPATAQAGDLVKYTIAVGNTGDIAFPDPLVVVGDALCEAPPQLVTRNGDASPATLDPGETWTYTCSVQTEVGQERVDNVATVKTTDVNGRPAVGSDGAVTTLAQPPVQVLPVQIRPVPAPPVIRPARVVPGRATLRGPMGCPSSRKATKAVVTGRQIRSVAFYVDGRRIRTVTRSQSRRRWSIPLRPRRMAFGTHRVRARVVFKRASGTKPKVLVLAFNRCRPRLTPTFTG